MKFFLLKVILLLRLTCCAQSPSDYGASAPNVITSDVTAFWEVYDRFWQDTTQNPFEAYLETGSAGLKDFIPTRIISAPALKLSVIEDHEYYDKIRISQPDVHRISSVVQQTFTALKKIYPHAALPDVYLVIGRITSGGTATENGIIVGLETFSASEVTSISGRKSLPLNYIPDLVAHELIHFQQHYAHGSFTLLNTSLREGSADFIASLMGYPGVKLMNGNVYEYGDEHEKELWTKFDKEKESIDYSDWLYNFGSVQDFPSDLGYWMGYKICEAYYYNAQNKLQALKDMLLINDFEEFLCNSGYPLKFKP